MQPLPLLLVSSFSAALPRWGQVSCPAMFESYYSKNDAFPVDSMSTVSSAINIDEGMLEANKKLAEEVQRLRAEVIAAYGLHSKCYLSLNFSAFIILHLCLSFVRVKKTNERMHFQVLSVCIFTHTNGRILIKTGFS